MSNREPLFIQYIQHTLDHVDTWFPRKLVSMAPVYTIDR